MHNTTDDVIVFILCRLHPTDNREGKGLHTNTIGEL